jgi:hypothetical protein
MDFGRPPEDLDYSFPLEPMRVKTLEGQTNVFKEFLTELVNTHPTKLTAEQRDDVRSVYRQVLLNVIYNSTRRIYTALPRGTAAFKEGGYWSKLGLTYRFTVAVLDRLVADEYLVQMKGVYNCARGFARLTRIFGTNKLSKRIDTEKLMQSVEFCWDDDTAPVVLTNFPYSADVLGDDHPDVLRVMAINKFLKNHAWQQKGPIRIIYKNNPMYGGRVYTRFQNLRRETRLEMKIDGEPVVELDYKANHLSMLIAMQGFPIPEDPYELIACDTRQTREQIKKFVTAALGASSEGSAFGAMKQHRFNRQVFESVRDALLSRFPGIPLFKGFGTALQSLEGQIALDIMYAGAKAGVVVLPVHDSFITTSKNKQWLLEQMMAQWANHVRAGAEVKIDAKAARQERHKESGHTGF